MKCARCGAELPGQAQFCLRCGSPIRPTVATAASGATTSVMAVRSGDGSRKGRIAALTALGLLLAVGLLFGLRAFMLRGNVVNATAGIPNAGGLLDTSSKINATSPITRNSPTGPAPLDPTAINDYLKFLKGIESQRIANYQRDKGALMAMIPQLEAADATAEMQSNEQQIAQGHRDARTALQQNLSALAAENDALARKFASRTPPQACVQLAQDYYNVLQTTSAAVASVGNLLNGAIAAQNSGDASKVGQTVQQLQGMDGAGAGTPARAYMDACDTADKELQAVTDKYHVSKEFSIQAEGGATANPFGG